MILAFIFIVSLVQLFIYYVNDRFRNKLPNWVILLIFLFAYFLVFPQFFYPEPEPGEDRFSCGLPIVGMFFSFWYFGTIAGVTTHFVWRRIKKISERSNANGVEKSKTPINHCE
jgi:hypothetical protein